LSGLKVLEIGAGSGSISAYFATIIGPNGSVSAVDVVDERVVTDGYSFTKVNGTQLPFPDKSFDLVISNHVIEHVGDQLAQLIHLQEIARVLNPNGIAYLAVPNRWRLIEPHFKLWFLSCIPNTLRSPYVRLTNKGTHYDCLPPGPLQIRSMIRQSRLQYHDQGDLAIRLVGEIENKSLITRITSRLPTVVLRLLKPIYPTLIFLLSPAETPNPKLS